MWVLGYFVMTMATAMHAHRAQSIHNYKSMYLENGGFIHPNLDICESVLGGFGLRAKHGRVPAGSVICETPRALLVAAEDVVWLKETAKDAAALGFRLLSPRGAVAARLCELRDQCGDDASRLDAHASFIRTLPTEAELSTLPVLWPDEEAEELLAGTWVGRDRRERLDRWQGELEAANARRRLHGGESSDDIAWEDWRYAQAVVLSRGYHFDGHVGSYAVAPVLDLVNHHDEDVSLKIRVSDRGAVSLVALRDIARGEEVRSSYSGGDPLDACMMLQAFGWLDTSIHSCRVKAGDGHEVAFTSTSTAPHRARTVAALSHAGDAVVDKVQRLIDASDRCAARRAAACSSLASADGTGMARASMAIAAAKGERAALAHLHAELSH